MSNYGFKAFNDSGAVTIDADFVTMAVARRGAFGPYLDRCRQYPDNRHGVRAQVTYSAAITSNSPPVVAFLPRGIVNGHWHAFQHTGGPGWWTGFEVSYSEFYPGQVVSNYYTFQPPSSLPLWDYAAADTESCPPSNETYGMRIWDENGRLTFDSGTPVIKLLGVVGGWSGIGNYPQWRSYVAPWPYPVGQNYGFIASNLPMQSLKTSYAPCVSPRFGFTQGGMAGGQIMCTVGGADRNSEEGLYAMIDSNQMPDDALPNWLAYNPIQLFAVQVE